MRASTAGVHGTLEATFRPNSSHVTAKPPLELRGPFRERDELPVYLLKNVTAGVFAGDRYDVTLRVEAGARVRVAAPSATKAFEMPAGRAESILRIEAATGSLIMYGPSPTILQAGSDFAQLTRIHAATDATVVYSEIIAFGRLASSEHMAFRRFHTDLSVAIGDKPPVYRERFALCPGSGTTLDAALAGYGLMGTLVCVGRDSGLVGYVRDALSRSETNGGVSALPGAVGCIVKVLGPTLQALTQVLQNTAASIACRAAKPRA